MNKRKSDSKKYIAAKRRTDLHLKALRSKEERLANEHAEILYYFRKGLEHEYEGSEAKATDIIDLNVGGKPMRVARRILTLIPGSRIEGLFSGRWDSKLLRDDKGRVFIDLDPYYFEKVIDYLLRVNVHKTSGKKKLPDLPKLSDAHEQKVFDLYVRFFRLQGTEPGNELIVPCTIRSSANNTDTEADIKDEDDKVPSAPQGTEAGNEPIVPCTIRSSANNTDTEADKKDEDDEDDSVSFGAHRALLNTWKEEVREIAAAKKEIDWMDRQIEDEEEFHSFFNDEDECVLRLMIQNHFVQVRHSTLCVFKDSQLADHFSSSRIKENSVRCCERKGKD